MLDEIGVPGWDPPVWPRHNMTISHANNFGSPLVKHKHVQVML